MLNSVLNAIPIYFLSFIKMPVKVWRKIVRIQREFLWGGVEGGRKIAWVRWSKVCLPKARGGLGVRDIRKVNLSLLAKWRWRLIHGDNMLWKEVLSEKYGTRALNVLEDGYMNWPGYASKWWKNVVGLERSGGSNWFISEVVRKVGNGNKTSFWNHVWFQGNLWIIRRFVRVIALFGMHRFGCYGKLGMIKSSIMGGVMC